MTTTENYSQDMDAPLDDISCCLFFQITKDNMLIFDAAWKNDEDIEKLAKLINAIVKNNLIGENLKDLDTDPKDLDKLLKLIDQAPDEDNDPIIFPLDVFSGE